VLKSHNKCNKGNSKKAQRLKLLFICKNLLLKLPSISHVPKSMNCETLTSIGDNGIPNAKINNPIM
jgi:hypothetical protein